LFNTLDIVQTIKNPVLQYLTLILGNQSIRHQARSVHLVVGFFFEVSRLKRTRQLSLAHITEPNFGPPYSHPVAGTNGRIIRAHTIAAITPSQDPDHYITCTLDLFSHYRNLLSQSPNCPLIINTPGWVLGTGLEILVRYVTR